MNCGHEIIENNYCSNCGCYFEKYASAFKKNHKIIKNINFEKELAMLEIPNEIKQWVIRKSSLSTHQISRMSCRSQILFAYIYLAYIDLKYENFKPERISQTLKISNKNIGIGLKYVSGIASSLLPQNNNDIMTASVIIISPIIYIEENLEKINKGEYSNIILKYTTELLKTYEILYEENPELMAIAIIKYYFDINNIKIFKFHTFFSKTQASIKNCIKNNIEYMNKILI